MRVSSCANLAGRRQPLAQSSPSRSASLARMDPVCTSSARVRSAATASGERTTRRAMSASCLRRAVATMASSVGDCFGTIGRRASAVRMEKTVSTASRMTMDALRWRITARPHCDRRAARVQCSALRPRRAAGPPIRERRLGETLQKLGRPVVDGDGVGQVMVPPPPATQRYARDVSLLGGRRYRRACRPA